MGSPIPISPTRVEGGTVYLPTIALLASARRGDGGTWREGPMAAAARRERGQRRRCVEGGAAALAALGGRNEDGDCRVRKELLTL